MKVEEVISDKKNFLDLLRLADEQEDMIDRYLNDGRMFVLYDEDLKGEAVVTELSETECELKNIAIMPNEQGKGYGKAILKRLAAIAVERGCGRVEGWCLDWNRSSIDFYLSLGAEPMSDWTVYRITGDTLTNLAK